MRDDEFPRNDTGGSIMYDEDMGKSFLKQEYWDNKDESVLEQDVKPECELKPCPFCGSPDIEIVRPGTNRVSCIMECSDCGCSLESNENGYGNAWNLRHEPEVNE